MSPPSIELNRLDPGMAALLRPALVQAPSNQGRANQGLVAAMLGAFAASLCLSMGLTMARPDLPLGMLAGFLVVAGGIAWATQRHRSQVARLAESVTAGTIREAAARMRVGRVEALYLQSVGTLIDMSETLGPTLLADFLEQLNSLLANGRDLQNLIQRLESARGGAPGALEAELEQLREKAASAPDDASRRALEESAGLCAARLARREALTPDIARIDSQLEVVCQSIATVEATLRGLTASQDGTLPDLEIEEIRRQTASAVQQSRAVEAAVEEVLQLSRG